MINGQTARLRRQCNSPLCHKSFHLKALLLFLNKNEAFLVNRMTETKVEGLPRSDLKCVYYFAIPKLAELCIVIWL